MTTLASAPVAVEHGSRPVAVTDVVLAAHGSRDPHAALDTAKLVAAVAAARPDRHVRAAYLDFTAPALGAALDGRNGPTIVVPLLLTPAYHARVDVPTVVAAAGDRGASVTTATNRRQIESAALTEICWPTIARASVVKGSLRRWR